MATDTDSLDFTERLLARHRGSAAPLLTWYGDPGERVELSGHVFDNWVAKSANLLSEEYDAGPGTRVLVDVPAHWKSLAIGFAVLATGAEILVPSTAPAGSAGSAGEPDLVVTDDPLAAAEAHPQAEIMAVALGALALSFPGALPSGALDYASEVRGFGDYFLADPVPSTAPALTVVDGSEALDYSGLFGVDAAEGTALLGPGADYSVALRVAIQQWNGTSPLVLLGAGATATQRILDDERVLRRP
ncbi:TIGR03089 family protein [Arthrobacter sp.]|uniref:TIGR03089 family protein n=1 Tax=Arthrobacter sp. TaxID=1667 RepID=UPI003A8EDC19